MAPVASGPANDLGATENRMKVIRDEALRDAPLGIPSMYYQRHTGYGPLHVTIVDRDHRPIRVFANLPPLGTEISALTAVMGILLSKYLEIGGDPVRIVKHLNSVKGDRPLGFGPHRIDSIAHAVGECLKEHLRRRGLMIPPPATGSPGEPNSPDAASRPVAGGGMTGPRALIRSPKDPRGGAIEDVG
ncbi:MAG: hypothetical protein HYT87_14715 [Nitrospirae bacterium]|nr:hypothetical protein [Nitrospirota bacterium]